MKERFKKFFLEHEEAACIAVGSVIGATFGFLYIISKMNDVHEVNGVALIDMDDGNSFFLVSKKNAHLTRIALNKPAE